MCLSGDTSVGEVAIPDGRCTQILLVISLFPVVLGGTCGAYEVSGGRESLSGSLSVSYMVQTVGMFFRGRRGGEMGDGGSVLHLVFAYRGVRCVGQEMG